MGIGWQELVLVLVLALVLFGPRRLPEIGRSLGNSMREFKDGISGIGGDSRAPRERVADAVPAAVEVEPGATGCRDGLVAPRE